jgi:hypothetical protein
MINNELRIGNWVQICFNDMEGWENVQVTEIFSDGSINTTYKGADRYYREPIVLNTEILEKSGFGVNMNGQYILPDENVYLYCRNGEWAYDICISANEPKFLTLCQIKYVHQLQNTFYILTSHELQITL